MVKDTITPLSNLYFSCRAACGAKIGQDPAVYIARAGHSHKNLGNWMWWKYLKYVAYYTCKVFLYTSISKIFIVTCRNKYHVSHVQAAGRFSPTVGVLLVFHLLPIMLVVVCVRLPDTPPRLPHTRSSSKWAMKISTILLSWIALAHVSILCLGCC